MATDLTKYKNIDFAAFVQDHGYSGKTPWARAKSSRNYPAFENTAHNDRIIVKKSINAYADARAGVGKYRDLIDFVSDRLDTVFKQFRSETDTRTFFTVLNILDGHAHGCCPHPPVAEKKAEEKNGRFRPEHFLTEKLPEANWLSKLYLPESTLNSRLFKDRVLFVRNPVYDESYTKVVRHGYGNVSFPYVREPGGVTVGFEQRNHNYKGHAIFSDKKNGVWFSNPVAETRFLLVTEARPPCHLRLPRHPVLLRGRKPLHRPDGNDRQRGQETEPRPGVGLRQRHPWRPLRPAVHPSRPEPDEQGPPRPKKWDGVPQHGGHGRFWRYPQIFGDPCRRTKPGFARQIQRRHPFFFRQGGNEHHDRPDLRRSKGKPKGFRGQADAAKAEGKGFLRLLPQEDQHVPKASKWDVEQLVISTCTRLSSGIHLFL